MPDIEITDQCRALIESSIDPLPQDGPQRLPNGNWQVQIDANTLHWLKKLGRGGETISDYIIIIVSLHKRSNASRSARSLALRSNHASWAEEKMTDDPQIEKVAGNLKSLPASNLRQQKTDDGSSP